MKRKELIRYLESCGCFLHREGKRHSIYVNLAKKRTTSLPRHQEIDDKLSNKICRDLEIPEIKK